MPEFEKRLSEVIAWCAHAARSVGSERSLRTSALRPAILGSGQDNPAKYAWLTGPEASRIMEELAKKRVALLREQDAYPSVAVDDAREGRLLVSAPYLSVWDGASQVASAGFIDDDDAPPWDTWLTVITLEEDQAGSHPVLVSWVPLAFVSAVDAAIDVNPVEDLRWATDADLAELHSRLPAMAAQ